MRKAMVGKNKEAARNVPFLHLNKPCKSLFDLPSEHCIGVKSAIANGYITTATRYLGCEVEKKFIPTIKNNLKLLGWPSDTTKCDVICDNLINTKLQEKFEVVNLDIYAPLRKDVMMWLGQADIFEEGGTLAITVQKSARGNREVGGNLDHITRLTTIFNENKQLKQSLKDEHYALDTIPNTDEGEKEFAKIASIVCLLRNYTCEVEKPYYYKDGDHGTPMAVYVFRNLQKTNQVKLPYLFDIYPTGNQQLPDRTERGEGEDLYKGTSINWNQPKSNNYFSSESMQFTHYVGLS